MAGTVLSVAALDHRVVDRCYATFASVYDRVCGDVLQAGRHEAIRELNLEGGEDVLEVGIGTGLTASLYPGTCRVTGIDASAAMLREAASHIGPGRNIELMRMDAHHLTFPSESFDVVYAAYVMSVVADPVVALREMRRVCRAGGRIVLLNHFLSHAPLASRFERLISPLTARIGFRSDVDLHLLLEHAGLHAVSIRKVNRPRIWSLVRCQREASHGGKSLVAACHPQGDADDHAQHGEKERKELEDEHRPVSSLHVGHCGQEG
ncbi:MAG: methyltransferase domain-containing protein [Acidobacteria bacterium]|nr:methyltransferase domain-containing protein [Acidobacteriota bacterium]